MADVGAQEGPAKAAAEEVVRALLRTAKTLRTYPSHNDMSRRAVADFVPRLIAAVPLELELRSDRLLWRGEPLLEAEPERSDLIPALYRDGIRSLHLRVGLEADEAQRFVTALATAIHPDDLSEDYVTRLWEAELPHVRVAAIDPYLDFELTDDVLEGKERPTEEPEDIGTDPEQDVPPPPEQAFRISVKDAERLEAEIGKSERRRPWASFIAALFETLESPTGRKRMAEVVPLLEASFQRLLDEKRFDAARKLIERLRARVPAEAKPMLRETVVRMVHPERLASAHGAVEKAECKLEPVEGLLLALSPIVTETVCEFLSRSTTPEARRFYAGVLAGIGKPALTLVLKTFRTAGPEAQGVLAQTLGRLRDPAATKALLDALRNPDPQLRREVVRALALQKERASLAAVLDVALSDSDAGCRIVALRGLGEGRIPLDPRRLLERVSSRQFAGMSDEEKDLLFVALGSVGSDAVVPFLGRLLTPSWIPGRRGPDEWRRAASALAHLGSPAALEALERGAKARKAALAAVCKAALRGVGRAR